MCLGGREQNTQTERRLEKERRVACSSKAESFSGPLPRGKACSVLLIMVLKIFNFVLSQRGNYQIESLVLIC